MIYLPVNPEPKKSKPFNYKRGIIILIASVAVILLVLPMFTGRTCRGYDQIRASNNAKQLALALYAFEDEYGSFPSESTVALVNEANPDHGYDLSGTSSNALFRQLFAAGITESEYLFHNHVQESVGPDGNIAPGEVLKKGEVNIAYISGLSSAGNPSCPIVLAPIIPGTKKLDFKTLKGQIIIAHIDNSAGIYTVKKDGRIYDKDGLDILSAKHPIWNGKTPDIRYPE